MQSSAQGGAGQQPGQQQQHALSNNPYISHNMYSTATNRRVGSSPIGGRVPDTSRDGRKLFVGGLLNEVTDQLFLNFFQQYGEVVDSVVLSDRKTKRSRGFGFVTFADPNVASCFLNKVPGRSGVITILGKECEVKASEPKTHQDEFADRSRDAYNYGKPRPMIVNSKLPSLQQSSSSSSHPGWFDLMPSTHQPTLQTQSPQQKISSMFANNSSGSGFGGGGNNTLPSGGNTFPHQLHVNQALLIPPTIDNGGGRGSGGVSIYSHSTITRSSNNTGASQEDGDTTVYIQNNFYLLPPGSAMTVPPNHANTVSPERLQAKQLAEFSRVATPVQQYAVSSSLHPSYPGPRNVSNDEKDWAAAATAASAAGGGRHVSFSPPKEASSYDIWQQKY